MDNNYNIVDSEVDVNLMIEDYNDSINSNSYKNLKIGVLGTALLCTSPGIYAANFETTYNISQGEISKNSISIAKDFGQSINTFIEEVNQLEEVNFTKREIIDQILSFKSLINNWDGYGALPVEIKSASNSIYMLGEFSHKIVGSIDDFYPNPHGTVVFEWVNDLHEKIYLEIGNSSFSYFVKMNSSIEPIFADNLEFTDDNIEVLKEYIHSI